MLRKHDNLPMTLPNMRDLLKFTDIVSSEATTSVIKLVKLEYLTKLGAYRGALYTLSTKGWLAKETARKVYFHGAKFWEDGVALGIEKIKKQQDGKRKSIEAEVEV